MKKNKKQLTIILLVLAVVVGVGAYFGYKKLKSHNQKVAYVEELKKKDEAQKATEKNPQSEADWQKEQGVGSAAASQNSAGSKQSVSPVITTLDQDSSKIVVRAISPSGSGTSPTCKVIFSKSGYNDVSRSAGLSLQGSYYACQGFDIEKSAFPAKGEWNVMIAVSSSAIEGTSASQKITIN